MMKFVLIVFFITSDASNLVDRPRGVAMQEFDSKETCEAAGKAIQDQMPELSRPEWVCVQK